jgi:hypothetical protein
MAQHLPDLGQRAAAGQHGAGRAVPQPVRSRPGQPRPGAGPVDHRRHRGDGQALDRRVQPQEHRAAPGTGTAAVQVGDQGLPDIGGQREPLPAAALAVNRDLPGRPVQVAQLQAGYLTGPQAQPGQQGENGPVAPAGQRGVVAAGQQRRHRLRAQRPGQAARTPVRHGRHRAGQLAAGMTGQEQEPQQRPQCGNHELGRAGRTATALCHHVVRHPRRRQAAQPGPAGRGAGRQELAGQPGVLARHGRCHSPLADQVAAVLNGQEVQRAASRRLCRHSRHASPAQVADQRHHSPDGQRVVVALPAAGLQELLQPGDAQLAG